MRKTRLSLLLLAGLAGCLGGRTPLLDPPRTKPDADLRTPDSRVDRQSDQALPDTKPALPDLAPDQAPDRARPDAVLPDASPDRAADLPNPDTRPPTPDLAPDRAADLPAPDLRPVDTRPFGPDLVPDRPQDSWNPDTLLLPPDRAPDRPVFDDAAPDAGPDLAPDLPPLDGPPFDLPPDLAPDLIADASPDAGLGDADGGTMAGCLPGTPYPLVLGGDQRLYRFDPGTLALTGIADVTCGDYSLNSMTASPLGRAYISNMGGQLCALDVSTFETALTPFDPNSIGNIAYGMALLSDSSAAQQSLYVATNNGNAELKTINLTSYTLGDIAAIVPTIPTAELTAGPNNGLFALYPSQPSSLLHLDPLTANSISTAILPNVASPGGFALVYWEDSFYLFMGHSTDPAAYGAYRYRTSDGQTTLLGTLPVQIIGAGVALCR